MDSMQNRALLVGAKLGISIAENYSILRFEMVSHVAMEIPGGALA
jgi:hypothetical protein